VIADTEKPYPAETALKPALRHGISPGKPLYKLVLIILVAGLSSCGFQLRGELSIPAAYNALQLNAPNGGITAQLVQQQLIQSGITLQASDPGRALHLSIRNEQLEQRSLAIREQETKVYEMLLSISYQLTDAEHKPLTPLNTIQASHSYNYDSQQVLSSVHEENIFQKELARQLADRIIRHVRMCFAQLEQNASCMP